MRKKSQYGLDEYNKNTNFKAPHFEASIYWSMDVSHKYQHREILDLNIPSILFSSGNVVGQYTFNDLKTLAELEKLSGYKVNPIFPISKIGSWYGGGIIFYEEGKGGGLVTEIKDNYWTATAAGGSYDAKIATSTIVGSGQANTKTIIDGCVIP